MPGQGIVISEAAHVVMPIAPIDITGGKTSARFSMAKYGHASIIVAIGVSAAAFTKIELYECTLASGGSATAIAYSAYKQETAAGDVLGAKVAVASTGITPSANDTIFYVIELDARQLTDGSNWVEVRLTNGSNSVIAAVIAILSGARYAHVGSETVLS